MKDLAQKTLQYLTLTGITAVACYVMWWSSSRGGAEGREEVVPAALPAAAQPKALVTVVDIPVRVTELTVKYSGKIRAWETYSLGFETPGRVLELGENRRGEPLDEGDRVAAGQLLARLDDRVLRARKAESVANYERAEADLVRARRLWERGGGAITDAEYQEALATRDMAKAQQEVAVKNLADALLVSPVAGVISKRMAEPGESVGANTVVFEVVENDSVLLVVDVPESRVRELEMRMRETREARVAGAADPEEKTFRARVMLEGRDAFGRPWPRIDAEVYRIAQVADQRTGLFEVEVRIDNPDGLLRPGMVASAEIVSRRLPAYSAPETAVVFRGEEAYVYTLDREQEAMQVMFWPVGKTGVYRARRVDLNEWISQGQRVVIPASSVQLGPIVVRGQQRIASGQLVRVTNQDELPEGDRLAGSPLDVN